jgi:hypothetical protein
MVFPFSSAKNNRASTDPKCTTVGERVRLNEGSGEAFSLLIEPLECPVFFVPVLGRETVGRGAEDGERKEAYS